MDAPNYISIALTRETTQPGDRVVRRECFGKVKVQADGGEDFAAVLIEAAQRLMSAAEELPSGA